MVFQRHQNAADSPVEGTVIILDERHRLFQSAQAGFLVPVHAMATALVEIVPGRGKAGRGVEPDAQFSGQFDHRPHAAVFGAAAQFAAHVDHGRGAAFQERGETEADPGLGPLAIMDGRAVDPLGCAVIHEAGTKEIASAAVEHHAVAGMGTDMAMDVDQTRHDEVVAGIDLVIDQAVPISTDIGDFGAANDHDAVADDAVARPVKGNNPASANPCCGLLRHQALLCVLEGEASSDLRGVQRRRPRQVLLLRPSCFCWPNLLWKNSRHAPQSGLSTDTT